MSNQDGAQRMCQSNFIFVKSWLVLVGFRHKENEDLDRRPTEVERRLEKR